MNEYSKQKTSKGDLNTLLTKTARKLQQNKTYVLICLYTGFNWIL